MDLSELGGDAKISLAVLVTYFVLNGCLQRHIISEITYLHGLQVNHCTPYTE